MDANNAVLRKDEQCILELRSLYESYGYKKYKMSKFEEYDLYLENKSFLKNSGIATVTDPKGRLLALKPDITLSIVRNIREASLPEKLYYNENIYIAESESGDIRENTQVGLEYIGELDTRALGETLLLAAKSLCGIDGEYCIALSHMGFISEVFDFLQLGTRARSALSALIAAKNIQGIKEYCASNGIPGEDKLCLLVRACGKLKEAIPEAYGIVGRTDALKELTELSEIIASFGLEEHFMLDFSVMNDMKYYNGLVFQGFLSDVPRSVLSGGRYDNLVRKFGKDASAIGFAISIDLLRNYHYSEKRFDCDVLLCYKDGDDPVSVLRAQEKLASENSSVIALKGSSDWIRYRRKAFLGADGEIEYESDC